TVQELTMAELAGIGEPEPPTLGERTPFEELRELPRQKVPMGKTAPEPPMVEPGIDAAGQPGDQPCHWRGHHGVARPDRQPVAPTVVQAEVHTERHPREQPGSCERPPPGRGRRAASPGPAPGR